MFTNTPMGFHIEFPNGWKISVQWGPGNYCETRRKNEDGWINPFDDKHHTRGDNYGHIISGLSRYTQHQSQSLIIEAG